jgi:hypothetical protein
LYHPDIIVYVEQLLAVNISSQEIEKRALLTCIVNIMKIFSLLVTKLRTYSNLSTNIINNKIDLFKKITNKYSPHLFIDRDTEITYKKLIDYGPNISVRRNIRSVCDKTLRNEVGQAQWQNVIYNNEKIDCQGWSLSTRFDSDNSEIILSDDKVAPTADITRSPLGGNRSLDLGPPIIINIETLPFASFNGDKSFTLEFSTDDNSNIRDRPYWELVDGPECLRFSNCVFDPNIFGRCAYTIRSRISTDPTPKVYIKQRGLYTVKVTVNYGFDNQTDILRIYVVDSTGEYAPGLRPPPHAVPANPNTDLPANFKDSSTFDSNNVTTDYLKCVCPNMSQFALSKTNGLFWPTKSDSYVILPGYNSSMGSTTDFNIPGMNKLDDLIFSGVKIIDSESDKKLNFSVKPGTSKVLWDNVILEHMRSEHDECAQCESFFQETLARSPEKRDSSRSALSGFRRTRRSPEAIALKRFTAKDEQYNVIPSSDEESLIDYLAVSMKYAPKINDATLAMLALVFSYLKVVSLGIKVML